MYDKVGTLFKYKSSIRALVSISEELLPKEHKICETSFLDLNDELDAEIVEIYLERIAKFTVQSNFSHVHGIQCSHIKGFTFAKIVIPWKFALQQALIANQTKLEG